MAFTRVKMSCADMQHESGSARTRIVHTKKAEAFREKVRSYGTMVNERSDLSPSPVENDVSIPDPHSYRRYLPSLVC